LSLRLLIRQASIPQTPPNRIVRNVRVLLLLDNLMHATNRPQVGFKAK
jgi:hypothetical protein